jgi:AraC family transcriptional regulator
METLNMTNNDSSNFVLHENSSQFYWEGNGQLSIKTFSNGKAYYKTDKGFFAAEEGRYLLLNEGPYTISIDEKEAVESFCLFFKEGFAAEVYHSLKTSNQDLLSDPYKHGGSIDFHDKTFPLTTAITTQLDSFKHQLPALEKDSIGYEEHFHTLMQSILNVHFHTYKEIESLHAVRRSTREELYKRVTIANEYIRAYFDTPITLQDISLTACLSTNHLVRTYNQVYGITPHQHISELRLIKSKKLLANPQFNMTAISFELGFQNPVSFSKMFKQHVGISPKDYRKKVIMDKKSGIK